MLVGCFGVGKSSVKRSLLYEPFEPDHVTTIGIETHNQDCSVDVDTAVDWKIG